MDFPKGHQVQGFVIVRGSSAVMRYPLQKGDWRIRPNNELHSLPSKSSQQSVTGNPYFLAPCLPLFQHPY